MQIQSRENVDWTLGSPKDIKIFADLRLILNAHQNV